MFYRLLADAVVMLHLGFILFVTLGGLAVLRWKRLAWAHVPAVVWGVLIELTGGICPLTPLENWLRVQGQQAGYAASFIEHYLIPVIYPTALTRELQIGLGVLALLINAGIYAWLFFRLRKFKHGTRDHNA